MFAMTTITITRDIHICPTTTTVKIASACATHSQMATQKTKTASAYRAVRIAADMLALASAS